MQVYVMFMITSLIKSRMGKLILTRFIRNNCPEFRNRLLDSYFFQTALGNTLIILNFFSGQSILKTILTR